jgi:hypothetical protein
MFNRREGETKVKKFEAGLAKIRHAGSLKSIQQKRISYPHQSTKC